jgi:hypothetical protein
MYNDRRALIVALSSLRPVFSSTKPRQNLGLCLLPGYSRLRISQMRGPAPVHFLALGLSQRRGLDLVGNTVPDFLDELKSVVGTHAVDSQGSHER